MHTHICIDLSMSAYIYTYIHTYIFMHAYLQEYGCQYIHKLSTFPYIHPH